MSASVEPTSLSQLASESDRSEKLETLDVLWILYNDTKGLSGCSTVSNQNE